MYVSTRERVCGDAAGSAGRDEVNETRLVCKLLLSLPVGGGSGCSYDRDVVFVVVVWWWCGGGVVVVVWWWLWVVVMLVV